MSCIFKMAAWLVVFLRGTIVSALFAGVLSDTCAPIEFDVKTLTSVPYWWFKTNARNCLNAATPMKTNGTIINPQTCIIMFSLCDPLPDLCPDQAACQTSTPSNVNQTLKLFSWPAKMGTNKYDGFSFGIGDNDFSIEYKNSDKVKCSASSAEASTVTTKITFQCDKKVKWNNTIKTNLPFTGALAPQPVRISKKGCIYNIVFNSSEGCKNYGPGGTPGTALSTGSIILILFFPSVFLYCAIGGMINSGKGKKGKEIMPNYTFWSDLPYLVLDGCAFVFACITCSTMPSGTNTSSYQSM